MKKTLNLINLIVLVVITAGCSTPETESCTSGDCSNGLGTMTYASGNEYVGNWVDGERNGRGTYKDSWGRVTDGIWENGRRTSL